MDPLEAYARSLSIPVYPATLSIAQFLMISTDPATWSADTLKESRLCLTSARTTSPSLAQSDASALVRTVAPRQPT